MNRVFHLAPPLALLLAAGLAAQPGETFVDTIDVQVVEIDAVVTDRRSRPVSGLKREDFELFVDWQLVEITNFYEATVVGERPNGGNDQGASAQGASSNANEGQFTVVLHLDDANVLPSHRTRLLRRLETAVEPWRTLDASFMLTRFEDRLEVLVPPTRDLNELVEAAAAIPKGSPRAIQGGESARRYAIRSLIDSHEACASMRACRPCEDNWGELLSRTRQYAANQTSTAAAAVGGLVDLVTTLGGVPGKKAVVYVTDGLPQRPGLSILDYLGNQLCRDLRPNAPSEVAAEMVQYDEASRFNRLAAHANANRVTFYALDAAGLRDAIGDISVDSPALAPRFENTSLFATNAQSGLHIVSTETGGKALVNANDLASLFDDVSSHLSASYSLGFQAAPGRSGEIRQVSVRLARHAARNRRIDYRRSYREKSLDERLAERLLSVAFLGATENPLMAGIGLETTEPQENNLHELTVAVTVPAEAIFSLPSRGGETGQLRLWLMAVERETGARTTVRQKSLLVGGTTGTAPINDSYHFEVGMNLPAGTYQIAVGVRDETTGVTSLIRESVGVPSAGVAGI